MACGASYTVRYRRRREGKTNYKRRLNLLKGGKPRLCVRKSNAHTLVQIIEYKEDGDKVLAQAHSSDLKKLGWVHATGNLPAAYLTGLLCGRRAAEKKVIEVLPDLGMASLVKGGRLYAALSGAADGGVKLSIGDSTTPSEERLSGQHIAGHVKKSRDITRDFESLKNKIIEGK